MLHLSISGLFGMIFEHLQNCFHPKDSVNGFLQLFQVCFHITQGHNPPQITHVLGMACLLTMVKPLGAVRPIGVGKHCINSQVAFYAFNSTKGENMK
jgi:hypothetical protein